MLEEVGMKLRGRNADQKDFRSQVLASLAEIIILMKQDVTLIDYRSFGSYTNVVIDMPRLVVVKTRMVIGGTDSFASIWYLVNDAAHLLEPPATTIAALFADGDAAAGFVAVPPEFQLLSIHARNLRGLSAAVLHRFWQKPRVF